MEIYITDGGKASDGFIAEKLDCTVRALALSRRISYKEAHTELEQAGRKLRHRYNLKSYLMCKPWAKCVYPPTVCGPSVRVWVKEHSDGNYIVHIRGHVFAVNHGMIMDSFKLGLRSRVVCAWEIELAK